MMLYLTNLLLKSMIIDRFTKPLTHDNVGHNSLATTVTEHLASKLTLTWDTSLMSSAKDKTFINMSLQFLSLLQAYTPWTLIMSQWEQDI